MFIYPHINRVALKFGPIKIYWYGIMYIVAFATAWTLAKYRNKRVNFLTNEQISDMIFYCAVGAVLGGRIGYVLFYDLPSFLHNPLILFKTWDGGMSFHGGLIGVIIAMLLFIRKTKKPFFAMSDFIAPLVPLGLGAGRIGNFINGELWGRITNVPWAIIYPQVGPNPRHPSEIYEFLLEGVVFFIIIWWFSAKKRPRMATSAMFLLCYGCFRFFLEFFRQPDQQLGFIAFNWLTIGQLLSLPMIIASIILFFIAYKKAK